MKIKKLITAISAVVLSASMCLGAVGCGEKDAPNDSHTHTYGEWVVETPPTCDEDGSQKRDCVDGDYTQVEKIDKLGHDYGEWDITPPTMTEKGLAKKVCSRDASHTVEVELPVLTAAGTGYDSVTKGEDGKKIFTIKNDLGDISFSVYAILSVEDAVDVGAANNSKVVSGTAEHYEYTPRWYDAEPSTAEISYEFGDNYVHIVDGTMQIEGWYTLNKDGSIFPVQKKLYEETEVVEQIIRDVDATADIFDGYAFSFMWLTSALGEQAKCNGAGNFIQYLYHLGSNEDSLKFVEDMTEEDEKTEYSFGYWFFAAETSHLFHIDVSFTLDENYVVDSATCTIRTYVSASYLTYDGEYVKDENGNYILSGGYSMGENGRPATDADGNFIFIREYLYDEDTDTVSEGMEDPWADEEVYTITQTSELEEGKELPQNPYVYEEMLLSSFVLQKDGQEVGDSLTLDATKAVTLQIVGIEPETYISDFDPIRLFSVNADGETEELSSSYSGLSDGHIQAYFSTLDYKIILNSYVAGDFKLLLKTEQFEKSVDLHVDFIDPKTDFGYAVYSYDEIKEQGMWVNAGNFEVYTGQTLLLNSAVAHPAYQTASYTASVDGNATLTDTWFEGEQVKMFRADTAGTYTVTLVSDAASATTVSFTVTVKDAPDLSEVLSGQYTDDGTGITVTFTPASDGATSGEARISVGDRYYTLISYEYLDETGTFNVEVTGGADNTAGYHNYGLVYTNACNLFLTFTTEFGETGRILLSNEVINELAGTFILASSKDLAEVMTVSLAGQYTLTYSGTTSIFWIINYTGESDEVYSTLINSPTTFDLAVGDTIKIWCVTENATVTIDYKAPDVPVTGVTLSKTAEMFVGGSQTLNLSLLPANATAYESIVWESSDPSVVTVDNNGTLSAVGAGEAIVTVTVTAADGTIYTATCTVTVKAVPEFNLEGSGTVVDPYRIEEEGDVYLFDLGYYDEFVFVLTVGQGKVYAITTDNAAILAGTSVTPPNDYTPGWVNTDDGVDLNHLTEGTYYFEVRTMQEGDTYLSFTVSEIGA